MLTYFFNPTQYVFIKELFIPKILSCGVVVGLVFVKQGGVISDPASIRNMAIVF